MPNSSRKYLWHFPCGVAETIAADLGAWPDSSNTHQKVLEFALLNSKVKI